MKGCAPLKPAVQAQAPQGLEARGPRSGLGLQSPSGMGPLALGPGAWSARLERLRPQVRLRLLRPQAAPG